MPPGNGLAACCDLLAAALGSKTVFPASVPYEVSVGSYYAAQQGVLAPTCIVQPDTVDEVALAIKTLTKPKGSREECPFAIRSGGHSSVPGASNIDGGITIDLTGLTEVSVSEDRSIVGVGVGNSWQDVYEVLDPQGLGVNGGRTGGVGVGGLTVGGGISWFSTRFGWTMDTVANFQVVLADGRIVNANDQENADLAWALRGGSNNFGVVTRVDLEAFEHAPFWGGFVYHGANVWPQEVREFVKINSADAYDEFAHLTLTWSFTPTTGVSIANQLEYTKPGVENPEIFDGIMGLNPLFSTMRTASTTELAAELQSVQANGLRQCYAVNTMVTNEAVLNATYARFQESLATVSNVAGLVWSYTLEPLPPALYARAAEDNALGLQDRTEALAIGLMTGSWALEADDEAAQAACRTMVEAVEGDAKALGVYDPFYYLNYAAPWQNPISSYGKKNKKELSKVAKKYDKKGVFTKQVPGGFKIPKPYSK